MKRVRWTLFLANWALLGVAMAQSSPVCDGGYAGLNVVANSATACDRWTLQDGATTTLGSQSCTGGTGGGGVQIGENFQYGHAFWGLEGTVDAQAVKSATGSVVNQGAAAPRGSYEFSGKLDPSFFVTLAPRVGFTGGEWMAYLKGGALIAAGSSDSTVTYTPVGSAKATTAFNGGRNFNSVGWIAGGGIELGLYGPWTIGFEYLHANLGKRSNAPSTCTGPTAQCVVFSGLVFENAHDALTSNVFRIAVNYYFT